MIPKDIRGSQSPIWRPFTQMKGAKDPIKVLRGKGALLELEGGEVVIDAISSWWVNLFGHGKKEIAQAIYDQSQRLEHVIFAGFTHEPAEQVALELTEMLPEPLSKVFFSDNGSTAVEVAMKMAYQSFQNRGEEKRCRFICFTGAYHGDTIGAMSLGERNIFNRVFEKLLFDVDFVPYPDSKEKEEYVLSLLEEKIDETVAAVAIEPLVQGVGGMRMCSSDFLQKLRALTEKRGALLIFDEVMTGFGRTGELFACLKARVDPDIICLAKGLTGGFLPMSVTVCTDEIFEAFLSNDRLKTFFHGHSYTANPLGCAAALATFKLLREDRSFSEMEEKHLRLAAPFRDHPLVREVRVCGTIAAFELQGSHGYLSEIGNELADAFLKRGVLVRPLGNVLYFMPPYCITEEQLDLLYQVLHEALLQRLECSCP